MSGVSPVQRCWKRATNRSESDATAAATPVAASRTLGPAFSTKTWVFKDGLKYQRVCPALAVHSCTSAAPTLGEVTSATASGLVAVPARTSLAKDDCPDG